MKAPRRKPGRSRKGARSAVPFNTVASAAPGPPFSHVTLVAGQPLAMDDTVEGEGWFVEGELGDVGTDKRSFDGDDSAGTEAEHVVCSGGVQHHGEVLDLAAEPVELAVRTARPRPRRSGTNTAKLSDRSLASVRKLSDD